MSRKLKAKLNDFVHGSGVDETVVSGLYLALKGARLLSQLRLVLLLLLEVYLQLQFEDDRRFLKRRPSEKKM